MRGAVGLVCLCVVLHLSMSSSIVRKQRHKHLLQVGAPALHRARARLTHVCCLWRTPTASLRLPAPRVPCRPLAVNRWARCLKRFRLMFEIIVMNDHLFELVKPRTDATWTLL